MKKNTVKRFGQKWKKREFKKEEGTNMPPKQCTCGRSASYPYCDGTHKTKKNDDIIESINENEKVV
jgi:CDGSH-type Zn-finger protein